MSGVSSIPPNIGLDPITGEQDRWCVKGQRNIYQDAKMMNNKDNMVRLITEERRVLTGSLHAVPEIYWLFKRHKCEWMAQDPSSYSEEIVREFYASYLATFWGSINKNARPIAHAPLTATLVRAISVDISETTIRRYLYGPRSDPSWAINMAEFDNRWDTVRGDEFQ